MANKKKKPAIILKLSKKTKNNDTTSNELPLNEFLLKLIKRLDELRDEKGTDLITPPFHKLPSKKLYSDYYEIIKNPISINEIEKKVKSKKYNNVDEFINDFKLMSDNASTYNDPESFIALDGNKIYEFIKEECESYNNSSNQDEEEEEVKEEVKEEAVKSFNPQLKQLLKALISYRITNRGKLSEPFMELVDPVQYSDYYTIIKEGMSFNLLKERLESGNYNNGSEGVIKFVKDASLIFKNAKLYNKEGSPIYKDAESLHIHLGRKFLKFKEDNPDFEDEKKVNEVESELEENTKGKKSRKADEADQQPKIKRKRLGSKNKKTVKSDDEVPDLKDEEPIEEEPIEEEPIEEEAIEEEVIPQYRRNHEIKQLNYLGALSISSTIKPYMQLEPTSFFFENLFKNPNPNSINIINLPNQIINQPLVILTSLKNKNNLINEKYTLELKINNEIIKNSPISIIFDESNKNNLFIAGKWEFKLSFGLNLIELSVKVPNKTNEIDNDVGNIDDDDKRLRSSRIIDTESSFITENIKIWINVTQ
ncbi:hypothetical protein CANARDRAFT_24001 [[Candida] arabinofermentans NRRL YB-2248]|uniref:Bromo domain-containing protein n=1 Tax=[Candida] arabinofermentans NRRL YB-2248 TaxID=983967 RepID=A0A1E4SYN4_9ASCO|nr:hypothetical protein CANARDRAFT_24001 [[Candida] arabinofermentans NRRL YB-2248]